MVSDRRERDALLGNRAPETTPLEAMPPSVPSTSSGHHVVVLLDSGTTWMDHISDYLQNQATPDDDISIEKVIR